MNYGVAIFFTDCSIGLTEIGSGDAAGWLINTPRSCSSVM